MHLHTPNGRAQTILQSVDEGLSHAEMPIAIFNDPDLHRLELERVFSRSWTYIGHVSEIPARGDYVVRYIAEDPFIFVRDEDGKIRLFWNSCRHKGTEICRVDRGNASHFRCPYHGWTYKNTGQLVGIPAFKQAYAGLDRSAFPLHSVPRLEEIYGFVFANLDAEAPSLRDSLGEATWYLDFFHGLGDMEVIGDPHRWVVDANWKIAAENFAGDEHHLLFLHRSGWKVGALQVSIEELSSGYHVHLGNGHTIDFCVLPNAAELGVEYFGYPDHIVRQFRTSHLSDQQLELAKNSVIQLGLIYPNFAHLHLALTPDAANIPPIPVKTVRVFQPKGPDRMEIWSWCLVWKEMPEDFKELSHRVLTATFSPSGIFEQDDVIPWNSITRAAGSTFARLKKPMLSYRQGFNGTGTSRMVTDWVGPGECYSPRFEEGNQRDFYGRWLRDMRRPVQEGSQI